jgi:hypothetical protein
MMQKNIGQLRNFFRFPAVGMLWIFLAFFSLFAIAAVQSASVPADGSACVQTNDMKAFPGAGKEDSAVRWDYRCRNSMPVRLENRGNPHTVSVPLNYPPVAVVNRLVELDKINHTLYCNNQNSAYYRRLWQRILPTRAGPSA